jgi:hypothetical protein
MFVLETDNPTQMCSLIQIQHASLYHGFWSIFFISIGILGLYLAIILISGKGFRGRPTLFLGLYTGTLAVLLMYLSSELHSFGLTDSLLEIAGVASLFLVGPFSIRLVHYNKKWRRRIFEVLHLVPAIVLSGCTMADWIPLTWLYPAGLIHIGLYLAVQATRLIRYYGSRGANHQQGMHINGRWCKRYTTVQIVSLIGVFLAIVTGNPSLPIFLSSLCLSILILLIWIRLLRTAYQAYITKTRNE